MKTKIFKVLSVVLALMVVLSTCICIASAAETSVTYTFSNYKESAAVTNYSKSLDDTITISLLGETQSGSGFFHDELRVYQGAYATITSAKEISSFVMLAGYKAGTYDISTSTDGTNWTVVVDDAAYTSAYSDHTITLPTAAKYIKLEATKQIRIKTLTVNFVGEATEEPVVPPVEPEVPENKDPAADSTLTVKEAIALGASKEHNVYTEGKYYVAGEITEVYNTQYGNMKIKDAEGNILTIYGTYSADGSARYDAMDVKPVAGDTVKIYGIVGQYNDTPQVKNGWIVEHTPDATPEPEKPEVQDPAADSTLTVAEAIALGASKEHNVYTEGKYYVVGEITEVYNTQYGNMKIKDAEGNILTVYGTYSADGKTRYDGMATKPVAGDTVKVYGIIGNYNGTAQIKNGWIVEHTPAVTPEEPEVPENNDPAADSTLTVAEAIALGASKLSNVYTEGKYYVAGEITEVYNEQYGNMKIKDAEGNILTIYGTYSADGSARYDAMEVKPVAGDTVKIYGVIGNYNGTAQIKNGWIVEHTPATQPEEPVVPPVEPEEPTIKTGTLSFADTTTRTVLTDTQQVWADNGITLTNDKGGYTNKIADYSNPARFYAKTNITIEYTGMTKIEIITPTENYAKVWVDANTDANATVSYAANPTEKYSGAQLVTIVFAQPTDSYVLTNLTAQTRICDMTVYGVASSEPEVPEVCTHAYDDEFDVFCNNCNEMREINYPADKVELKEIDGVKYIYVNGITSVEGLFKVGDDYYYATWGGVVLTGDQYVHLSYCDKAAGKHLFFAEDGKMVVKGFATVDGVKKLYIDGQTSVEGLFEVDGKYYLATWGGVVLTDGRYYVTESFVDGVDAGKEFTVDENGAVLDGIVEIEGAKYLYDLGTTVVPGDYDINGTIYTATWGGLIVE